MLVKFVYSEKATKLCQISTLLSKVEIWQNFVAFSEYMNFRIVSWVSWNIWRDWNHENGPETRPVSWSRISAAGIIMILRYAVRKIMYKQNCFIFEAFSYKFYLQNVWGCFLHDLYKMKWTVEIFEIRLWSNQIFANCHLLGTISKLDPWG